MSTQVEDEIFENAKQIALNVTKAFKKYRIARS